MMSSQAAAFSERRCQLPTCVQLYGVHGVSDGLIVTGHQALACKQ